VLASRNATTGVYTSLYTSTSTGASYKDATGATVSPVLASTTVAAYVPPRSLAASAVRALYAKVSDGVYTFTFPSAPATAPTLTLDHTLAIYGTRTFAGTAYPFHAEHHFNPAAGAAAAKREVVSDAACNGCHQNMQAHDSRRGVGTCLTCHSPQTTDPETGNTMDLRVMVHKIHRGAQGTDPTSPAWKYQVVGYGQSLMDFSHVSFAAPGNTVRNCSECHQGAQADNFKTKPSIAACGSCHYTVDFATGTGHQAGAKADGSCAACHDDADIAKVHSPNWDPTNNVLFTGKALDITIDDVTNVVAGAAPVITFTVKVDGVAYDAKANPLAQLRFTVAGPTTDYSGTGKPAAVGYVQSTNFNNATNAALLTATGTAGQFTAPGPTLAATAAGTMAFGVEAYIAETKADPGGTNRTKNWNSKTSAVVYKAIGGGTATARREIVDDAKCNACHVDLGFHSNSARKNARYCAFCHNPNNVNDERVSRFETAPDGSAWKVTPESVQLSVMVHKIHMGGDLANPYTLGGNPSPSETNPAGNQSTVTGVYPGDIGNCLSCHKPGTYGLPNEKLLATKMETWKCTEDPTADTDSFCDPLSSTDPATWVVDATTYIPPQASACNSCHDGDAAKAHAALNTYNGIETCAVCHGAGKDLDPVKVHQARP
jgi:OmcA/MtrC family decaheme c-type cytochrome